VLPVAVAVAVSPLFAVVVPVDMRTVVFLGFPVLTVAAVAVAGTLVIAPVFVVVAAAVEAQIVAENMVDSEVVVGDTVGAVAYSFEGAVDIALVVVVPLAPQ
jgi:hypothetical protein